MHEGNKRRIAHIFELLDDARSAKDAQTSSLYLLQADEYINTILKDLILRPEANSK